MMDNRELEAEEDAAWSRFMDEIEPLSAGQLQEPGYIAEGWSVKDLLAHVGAWQAEAGQVLEQIRNGTFEDLPVDVDAMNRRFHEADRDLPLPIVRAELWAARTRMLTALNALPEVNHQAEEWFRESGALHYEEHLPRLREWAAELRSR